VVYNRTTRVFDYIKTAIFIRNVVKMDKMVDSSERGALPNNYVKFKE